MGGRNGDGDAEGGCANVRVPCGGRYTIFVLALDPDNINRSACVGLSVWWAVRPENTHTHLLTRFEFPRITDRAAMWRTRKEKSASAHHLERLWDLRDLRHPGDRQSSYLFCLWGV